uniref:Tetraspanin n=1 Tax=Geotrypetes seraphini TaxID=260995 RepID=A0A6P8PW11_GEOSA|nr:tetraspanin-16 [Geotrypetes seraphini]XP_033779455.1 tetraspanin-16 [Geotrypetes seraphini]XP_033779456.1 tetraspanin-16 [Geotrypetes seraphini]XP_033779457.1 tetraspanin-16 [Geotrypetes seraphini]XP_033779458.1 tetraspanin-16 [Geotrypetes seraphini]
MGCFVFLKTMMFIFNSIIFVGGAAVLGIGIWVKVDGGSFVNILGVAAPQLTQLINVGYLCIAIGSFLLLMGFLGCYGAVKENRCMLMLFFSIILFIFIAEVAGAVVVLAFSAVSQIFLDHLSGWAMKTLREDYGTQPDITLIWNTAMKELKCCGFNNYTDFNKSNFFREHNNTYPSPCCSSTGTSKDPCTSPNLHDNVKGCYLEFQEFLSKNGKIVGGVALGICALELAAMAVSLILFCQISSKA